MVDNNSELHALVFGGPQAPSLELHILEGTRYSLLLEVMVFDGTEATGWWLGKLSPVWSRDQGRPPISYLVPAGTPDACDLRRVNETVRTIVKTGVPQMNGGS